MKWEGREESENIEDRRGLPAAGGVVMGGGLGMLVMILLAVFLGINPQQLMQQPGFERNEPAAPQTDPAQTRAEEPVRRFVGVVFRDTEDVWTRIFREDLKRNYQRPKLVVFSDSVNSACGRATASVGPFYCPGDANVYLDFSFFQELQNRFHAKGEFAMAYVIAHEVGHHVQNLLGISDQVEQLRRQANEAEGNRLSVRLELQADFLAGVWSHHLQKTKKVLEEGDLEDALNAASQIGDNKIQSQFGAVRPEKFTHGSDKARKYWLREGIVSGDVNRMMELFELDFKTVTRENSR